MDTILILLIVLAVIAVVAGLATGKFNRTGPRGRAGGTPGAQRDPGETEERPDMPGSGRPAGPGAESSHPGTAGDPTPGPSAEEEAGGPHAPPPSEAGGDAGRGGNA